MRVQDAETVKALNDAGADVNAKSEDYETLLQQLVYDVILMLNPFIRSSQQVPMSIQWIKMAKCRGY